MNNETRNVFIDYLKSQLGSCSCSPKERRSGHKIGCSQPDVDENIHLLIDALQTDETIN